MLVILLFSLVVNEVMYNPLGQESGTDSPGDRNEYIELYNESDDTVCIDGYFIQDNMEKDSITPFPDPYIYDFCDSCRISRFIPPHSYAVILDQDYLHQGEEFAPYRFGKNTVLLSTYDSDIGNGLSATDNLYLIHNSDTIDTYGTPFTEDNLPLSTPDGISVERLNPYYPDGERNWVLSDSFTPGYKNSKSFEKNLSIDSVNVSAFIVNITDTIHYKVYITNTGWSDISNFKVYVQTDDETESYFINRDLGFLEGTSLSGVLIPRIRGINYLHVYHDFTDDNAKDNSFTVYITAGVPQIVINEIMYNDTVEWIEIYNASSTDIHTGFKIRDRSGNTSYPTPMGPFSKGTYIVIAKDSAFEKRFPGIPFFYVENFPTLNNSSETVYLLSERGVLFDSVYYTQSYGGDYGRSLEKINPFLPSSNKSSWETCKDPQGGTPSKQNSVFIEIKGSKNSVFLSSHTIQYSLRRAITFTFRVENGPVKFYLFSMDGKPYGLVYYEEGNIGEWTWKGYLKGHKLPQGPYILYIEGNNFKQKEIVIIEE